MYLLKTYRNALVKEIQTADKRLDEYEGKLEPIDIHNQTFIRGYRIGLVWAVQTLEQYCKKDKELNEKFGEMKRYFEGGYSHANRFEKTGLPSDKD